MPLVILLLVISVLFPLPAKADGSCEATISPNNAYINTNNTFTLTVTNTGDLEITYLVINKPDGAPFDITSGSTSGWGNMIVDAPTITFYSGDIPPGSSNSFNIVVTTTGDSFSGGAWSIEDRSNEPFRFYCSGDLNTSVSGTAPAISPTPTPVTVTVTNTVTAADTTGPTVSLTPLTSPVFSKSPAISGQAIDNTGVASAEYSLDLITWYPITLDTKSAKSTTFKFTPGVTKTGNYTVRVRARDTNGIYSAIASLILSLDLTPPIITLSTDLSSPFPVSPKVSGSASDKSGVSLIEFSADSGLNWQPAEIVSHTATLSNFIFTPAVTEDGDYSLMIRATDTAGNISDPKFNLYHLIIDRLPPRIGQFILTSGTQILEPQSNGKYFVSANTQLELYISVVGGPKSVTLTLSDSGLPIPLDFSPANHLWHSQFSILSAGTHSLTIQATDPNSTDRALIATLITQNQGRITSSGTPLSNATITVYIYDENSGSFSVWDGTPFGFKNPQKTDNLGRYSLSLPGGKYYLKANAQNQYTQKTDIFILDHTLPVTQNFNLAQLPSFKLGPFFFHLPGFFSSLTPIPITFIRAESNITNDQTKSPLTGLPFPKFNLVIDSKKLDDSFLHQKNTLVSLLPAWSPLTAIQLKNLSRIRLKPNTQIIAFAPQNSPEKTAIISHRLGLSFPYIADPDSDLFKNLALYSTPSYLLLDQRGTIVKIIIGGLSEESISSLLN